jgi:hypothetical protein
MKLRKSIMATDEHDNEVLMARGDEISEIGDNGPIVSPNAWELPLGWDVIFRFTPSNKLWSEIVTCDAIKLLKALEG